MIKLEKICTLTIDNPHNLCIHQFIEIFSVLHSAYIVLKDQNKIIFYINNYIN